MPRVPDLDGEDHLSQQIATDEEVDDTDGGLAGVVNDRDGNMEDHVVHLRIERHVADVGCAGCGLYGFTPPDFARLLRRQPRICRGDDLSLPVGNGDTHIVPGLARPFVEVACGVLVHRGRVVGFRMSR